MEIRFCFGKSEGKGSISIINENVNILIDESTEIYKKLKEEIENGLMDLKEFRNSGIPGMIKYNRKYKYKEDILGLLKQYRQEFFIQKIVTTSKSDNLKYNIVEIDGFQLNSLFGNQNCILEFDNRYEYCIAEDYEERYGETDIKRIELDQVFIKLGTMYGRKEILAIDFMKEKFNIEDLVLWLETNNIEILKDKEKFLDRTYRIRKALKFKGTPIVLFQRGKGNKLRNRNKLIEIGELEIEEEMDEYEDIRGSKTNMLINLNGVRIDFIPEIEIDLSKDLVFSNGHFMAASYIGEYYKDDIAFLKRKGDDLPLALILNGQGEINITIREKENSKIIHIESNTDKIDINNYFSY